VSLAGRIALRGCLLGLVIVTLAQVTSSTAVAMICTAAEEPVAATEDSFSSQLAPQLSPQLSPLPAPVAEAGVRKAKKQPLRCESFGALNCDVDAPDGAPSAPEPLQLRRPIAALVSGDIPDGAPRGLPVRQTNLATANNSDFIDRLFRPPRRS
jgi:hypothetical protein